MRRTFLSAFMLALPLAAACGGQASTVCDLECECEHCNDIREDVLCSNREAEVDIAEAYGCATQWEDWATCYEEQGTCDEKAASFSTRAPGSCSGTTDLMTPCTTAADCNGGPPGSLSCTNGTCMAKTCAGNNNNFCETSDDCPTGEDRCEAQAQRLYECERGGSTDYRFIGGDHGNGL